MRVNKMLDFWDSETDMHVAKAYDEYVPDVGIF